MTPFQNWMGSICFCFLVCFFVTSNITVGRYPVNVVLNPAISKVPTLTVKEPEVEEEVIEDEEAVVEEEAGGSDEGDAGRPPSDNPYWDVVRQTGEPYGSCFDFFHLVFLIFCIFINHFCDSCQFCRSSGPSVPSGLS